MFKKLLIPCLVVIALACHQDENMTSNRPPADIAVRDGMLVFASEEVYANTLIALDKMNPAEKQTWASNHRFTPLISVLNGVENSDELKDQLGLSHLSPSHWYVLNHDRFMEVGGVVTYFNDTKKYFMNADEFRKLGDRNAIVKSTWTGVIQNRAIEQKTDASGRTYFDAWNNGSIGAGGGQYSYTSPGFYPNSSAGPRKFVVEWRETIEQTSSPSNGCGDVEIRSRLYLACKNLRQSGSSWVPVAEFWHANVNVSVDGVRLYYGFHNNCSYTDAMWGPVPPYSGYYASFSEYSGLLINTDYFLLIASPPDFYGEWHATRDLKKWEGYATGSVYMKNDDVNQNHSFGM